MAGGDSAKCPPDKEEEEEDSEPFSDIPLSDAPILLLVYFHRAMRKELSQLRCIASALASETVPTGRQLILDLRRRLDFFKLVHKYHSAVEEEVIFLALDVHKKNIIEVYSLEHHSIEGHFDSIFNCLRVLEEDKDGGKPFQELLSSIATLYSSICKHMIKEEEQVFPSVMQHVSPKEQALLAWQFFCSIPVILLMEFLPWMISFFTLEQQRDITCCIQQVLPQEKSLQEVVLSWLHRKDLSSSQYFVKTGKEAPCGPEYMKNMPQFYESTLRENMPWKKTFVVRSNARNNVNECLHLWHHAIQKDLKEILEEAYQRRTSTSSSDIDSMVVRLKFLADVIIFYSYALKKFFYPLLNECAKHTCTNEQFYMESCIESVHQLLQVCREAQNGFALHKFVENLCQELKSLVLDVNKHFSFQEVEVFPLISKFSNDIQQQLLYNSLQLMPLGLLKCVIPWFAVHLSEKESRLFRHGLNQGDYVANPSFASLLVEWFRNGYSGKMPIESFGTNLKKLFKRRSSFIPEHIKYVVAACSSLLSNLETEPCKIEPVFSDNGKNLLPNSSVRSNKAEMYEASYTSNINLHIFFPETKRFVHPFPQLPVGETSATSIADEPKPVDLIFFFHKALKKDLDHLVSGSAQLEKNITFLVQFSQCFHVLWFRYQFHSHAEDEIAFPALEAKGNVQNISYSYSIDHKLENELFTKISLILEKMSKLHVSVSSVDSGLQDHTVSKYNHLCVKLNRKCRSMHKLISDHIHHEEIQLWPLFRECCSIEEQENIIGLMLGKVGAESLQDMITWLIGSLTPQEQCVMMSLWRNVTKNTMFDEWLGEWLERYDVAQVAEPKTVRPTDPLEIISNYLSKNDLRNQGDILSDSGIDFSEKDSCGARIDMSRKCNLDNKEIVVHEDQINECLDSGKGFTEFEKRIFTEATDCRVKADNPGVPFQSSPKSGHHEHLLSMSQDDLESAIRKISRDSSLDPQKKSYIIQNLLMSRWIVQQQKSHAKETISDNGEDIPGRCPSYRDPFGVSLGCKHYKRNCKLVTTCCNKLYTCIRCHDDEADHSTARRGITKMMCMKCLTIQPIGKTCSSSSCNNLSMAKYYCHVCKLFDDERAIYHCPYCNLCRVGKGLGVDYFHCMKCNACMSMSLLVHVCREKCQEENCPICHEYIFTSSNPVKGLPCGHLMHSTCFQEYTCTHYICPICSKSLGDMQVYFKMLDALLAEEKLPDEYIGKTQVILCNDCEKRGTARFHWHYRKCPFCGSYNTRLL